MPNYRRNRVPGGTYFFTVNLLERKSTLLTEPIVEQASMKRSGIEGNEDRSSSIPFHYIEATLFEEYYCIGLNHGMVLSRFSTPSIAAFYWNSP